MKLRLSLLLLLSAGCKDEGLERYQRAHATYQQCAEAKKPATDPCFAEVEQLLASVPDDSTARARADGLQRALEGVKGPRVRTPLAFKGGSHLSAEVTAQLAECQRLAAALGTAPEAERPQRLRALDACRAAAERLDADHQLADGGHREHSDGGQGER